MLQLVNHPNAFAILAKVAMLTSRGKEDRWVKIDYKEMGMTRAMYRMAKDVIITTTGTATRTTNRGTFFKLNCKQFFDINENDNNQQNNQQNNQPYIGIQEGIIQEGINKKAEVFENSTVPQKELSGGTTIREKIQQRPEIHIDLYEMARDNDEIAERLLEMNVL